MSDGLFQLPFGLNIKVPTRTLEEAQKTLEKQVSSLWTPLFNFLEENEPVFNGDLTTQLNAYNRFTYNLGAIMREGQETHNFNMKM